MRKTQIGLLAAMVVILLSNIFPVRFLFEPVIKSYEYESLNSEFEFLVVPAKGRDTDTMERNFQKFLENNPQSNDTIIYRTFQKNPLEFWNWGFYLASDLYNYELKN